MVVVAPAASFHHTHHHHHHHEAAAAAAAAAAASSSSSLLAATASDHPIFPLLAAGHCVLDPDANKPSSSSIQFWQPQPSPSPTAAAASAVAANPNPSASSFFASAAGGGAATCQDCGNQAKKDCSHRRCRTCCKSRGFECSTHVKSTWVPAARRRERQHLAASASSPSAAAATAATGGGSSKKPRLLSSQTTSHTSTSNATTPRSFDTSSSHQDASFRESLPRHVRAPAVFRCVRVTSIDDGEDEYAYQAMVTINGHVFKGFLYDQGVDDGHLAATSNDDSTAAIPNISELHLGGGRGGGGAGGNAGRDGASSSSPMLPSDLYGGGGAHILGATSYGNPMS